MAPSRPSTACESMTESPPRPLSVARRETFSPPPLALALAHRFSSTSIPSLHAPPSSYPDTAASSALALTAHVPGLGALPPVFPADYPGAKDTEHVPLPSAMLLGEVSKPWMREPDARARLSYWITICTSLLGLVASAAVCYLGYAHTPVLTQPLCLVMHDDFSDFSVDADGATWMREIDMGGFGNGQFEMTTASPNNSFVRDGQLYIVPTLTSLALPGGNASVFDGYTYNITGCTSAENFHGTACGAVSNATSGTVINPVMSARLTTRKSHSIRFGKVEIRAKTPPGDWLWPALWMLPVNETYGPWPLSGEIDIMESRGNGPQYPYQGNNVVSGSLNWGPTIALNAVTKTMGTWLERRTSFSAGFHTYTLEWTHEFLRIYVDTRLHRMLDLRFTTPFFARGAFPATIQNASQTVALTDPWLGRGNAAPFDQPFFLILDVAVGGTNGWFPDGRGGKPWLDGAATAMRDFAQAQAQWYPTWPAAAEERALVVDYVKMWQLC